MQLPYTVDDDQAAIEAVGAEINRPDPARWQAMTTGDDRLRQTYRVLGQLIKQVEVAFTKRKAVLRAFRGPRPDYHQAVAVYEEWKSRTVHFANCARARRGELEDRVRRINQHDTLNRMATALQTLTQAVADHRDAIRSGSREETAADRMLWLRLELSPYAARQNHMAATTSTAGPQKPRPTTCRRGQPHTTATSPERKP
ncbi:hypothetical protein [Amycolatopsis sp. NPDC098790]|uniref:hypothetical protein n=1 Tax=Amycolatopsis sp. NPDC098790 TaxID=3363939 RepID=UPI0038267BA4